jgi:hypothetical protein
MAKERTATLLFVLNAILDFLYSFDSMEVGPINFRRLYRTIYYLLIW